MAVNKVQYGGTTLIDLTADTLTSPSQLAEGIVAHDRAGNVITGTASGGTSAISVVDTLDSHGGTIRTITALDISDTTAVAGDVASGKYFYTADGTKTQGTASGGGSVTVTDEANATGITCVITTGGSPAPSGIPLNTQLIDFTAITNNYAINSSGQAVAEQWYSVSDYTEIDPSMTFSYSGCYWFYIGFYDASKNTISALSMMNDATQRSGDTNYCDGTLTPAKIPSTAKYVRITSTMNPDSTILSLIRTA